MNDWLAQSHGASAPLPGAARAPDHALSPAAGPHALTTRCVRTSSWVLMCTPRGPSGGRAREGREGGLLRTRPVLDQVHEPEVLTAAMTGGANVADVRRPRCRGQGPARGEGGPRSSTPPRRGARSSPGWKSYGKTQDGPQRRLRLRGTCCSGSRTRTVARCCGRGSLGSPARSAARAARSHRPWATGWGERWERKWVWAGESRQEMHLECAREAG